MTPHDSLRSTHRRPFAGLAPPRRRPRHRLVTIVLGVLVAVLAAPSSSSAQVSQAFRYLTDSCCLLQGSRANITNPTSSEVSIQSVDWFLSSAEADTSPAGFAFLIQTGVTYEFNDPEGPGCDLGSGSPELYYFVEVVSSGVMTCYVRGLATFGEAHLQSVVRNNDGYWRAYRDGVYQNVRMKWSPCGGNACQITALGEDHRSKAGDWVAKFGGIGQTPWQRWTGSTWFTIQQAFLSLDPGWTNAGVFPEGIWTLTYHKG
jgi:hypothetical protein